MSQIGTNVKVQRLLKNALISAPQIKAFFATMSQQFSCEIHFRQMQKKNRDSRRHNSALMAANYEMAPRPEENA